MEEERRPWRGLSIRNVNYSNAKTDTGYKLIVHSSILIKLINTV
jgi:hypothetical protein